MPTNHAILAPSASKRWMTCAPSARAEAAIPSQDTAYTREGTIAHSTAEYLLTILKEDAVKNGIPEWKQLRDLLSWDNGINDIHQQCRDLGLDEWEMTETVYTYYVTPVLEDYVNARAEDPEAVLLIEAELKLDSFIPEGFGSSDAVLIYGERLHVYDLKYGKGVKVDAYNNTQMLCYAIGAAVGPAELYAIKEVEMTILQPRLQHESSWTISWTQLYWWATNVLRPAARKAFDGEGEYVAGDHCKFCRFAPRCRASWLRAKVMSEALDDPQALSDPELSLVLSKLESIKNWAAKVEDYALQRALNGRPIPGWKVVEGRSIRKIADPKAAYAALIENNFEPDMVLKEPELKTLGELEKMLGKTGKAILEPFIVKPAGKPTLAPNSDRRPALADAKEDFKDTIC